MKKILLSILTIGLMASVVFGATRAFFSDTETSVGNTFTAGTIDLKMNDENPRVSAIFTFEDMKPSEDMAPIVIKLKNVGQNNGYLYQKIDYIDKDKVVPTGSEFVGDMSADKFAALIYLESIDFLLYIDGVPSSQGSKSDLPGMIVAMDNNNDDKVSLYELKEFGWMPYSSDYPENPGDPDDTLQVGHTATWTIVFHMGDSLEGWALDGNILTGVKDNRPQADGIELTWTAVLEQNPGPSTP
jgi:predicted ribosomally synthesized peptide with SipW-like signal peptide